MKSQFRQEMLKKRNTIRNKAKKDRIILEKLLDLPEFIKANTVLTYVSTEHEVDTISLIEHCFRNNISVAVPGIVIGSNREIPRPSERLSHPQGEECRTCPQEEMQFFLLLKRWEIGKRVNGNHPNDVCITPGVAFCKDGNRLGYGGGYYDRFFGSGFSGSKIGLCYEEFLYDSFPFPVEKHDEKVKIILSNDGYQYGK